MRSCSIVTWGTEVALMASWQREMAESGWYARLCQLQVLLSRTWYFEALESCILCAVHMLAAAAAVAAAREVEAEREERR